jgi:hypothetical protein
MSVFPPIGHECALKFSKHFGNPSPNTEAMLLKKPYKTTFSKHNIYGKIRINGEVNEALWVTYN